MKFVLMFIYLIAVNLLSFFVYGLDKQSAQRHMWRIPENFLITLAAIGGSMGAILAMRYFHHKTKKDKFRYGVPSIFAIQFIIFLIALF